MRKAETTFNLDWQERPLSDMNLRLYPAYLAPALAHIHRKARVKTASLTIDRPPNYSAIFTALAYNANYDGLVVVSRPFLPNMLLMGGNSEDLFIIGLRKLLDFEFMKTHSRYTNPHNQRVSVTYELNPFFTGKGPWPAIFRRRLLWGGIDYLDACLKSQQEEVEDIKKEDILYSSVRTFRTSQS